MKGGTGRKYIFLEEKEDVLKEPSERGQQCW